MRNFPTGGQLVSNGLTLIKDLLAATKVDAEDRGVPARQRHIRNGAARGHGRDLPESADAVPARWNSIAYDPKAQDLSVEVTKIRSINPDLVLVVTRAADAIKLVRDMVRQRFEPKGIISPGSPGLYDEEFYQALGPLADFHICNLPWVNPKAQMTQALEAAFKPAHPNNRFAVDCFNVGFTFEALLIAADGFKRAGDQPTVPS